MYYFLVSLEQIGESYIRITGSDAGHIKNILRMKPGEQVLISNGMDKDYHCKIDEASPEEVTAKILSVNEEGTELPVRLYLFQGLLKSDKMELTVQKAVELGVYQVISVTTKRAVVKLGAKKEEARMKRWNFIAESAAKQPKRLTVPEMTGMMSPSEAFALAKNLDVNLISFEHAEDTAGARKELERVGPGKSVGIFIGPEDGFENNETEAACEADTWPVTLGKRILRTEMAGLATLSILMLRLES